MSALGSFLHAAKRRLQRHRAVVWGLRGLGVAAVVVLVAELVSRRWPMESQWPAFAAAAAAGAVVALVGWAIGRPSLAQVARIADRNLGGHERLATAWELAEEGGPLVSRQRSDAETWASGADLQLVVARKLPRPELASTLAAVLLAGVLVVLPNSAVARERSERAAELARNEVADDLAEAAREAEEANPGEDPERRRALVDELRAAERAIREADDVETAVAALSRSQRALEALSAQDAGRLDAASAAGHALASSGAGSSAGSALAAVGDGVGDQLASLAESLPELSAEEQAALAEELAAAAEAATDPEQAEQLQRAADELEAGRTEAAQEALSAAAEAEEQRRGELAAAELEALADALADLTAEERAELAEALDRAAAAAGADTPLADELARAGSALRGDDLAAAIEALRAAAARSEDLAAESDLDGDVSEASNEVQEAKEAMLECGSSSFTSTVADPAEADNPTTTTEAITFNTETECARGEPAEEEGEAGESGTEGSSGGEGSSSGGGGEGSTGAGSAGSGGSGAGGDGTGAGLGGAGSGGGGSTGGGGAFGARGGLGETPGEPSEEVYIPGLVGPGRTRSQMGAPAPGPGADSELVPFESVYREYRASALSQADRQLIPAQLRDLLREYFQADAPRG